MLTPQFILPLARELVIDLFAGGGGASTGIEDAIGRHVDIAVNHDREAVALHQANHPQTRHYVEDVFAVDPLEVTEGRSVGLLWGSPDCKHFSKAKGGKPVSKKIRGLAWVLVKWAKLVRPRVIFLENVEEFQTWGPLGEDNRPCPKRKGRTFRRWVGSLKALGYTVEFREIRADTLGTPTIRNRLYMIARCDGQPIVWPASTHGKGLQPVRTAAECIDWHLPCHSIFLTKEEGSAVGVKRPLAEATMRRIAKGVQRYVIDAAEPFIVGVGGRMGQSPSRSTRKPFQTVTAKADSVLAVPMVAPLTHHGENRAKSADQPIATITGAHRGELALITPLLTEHANASNQRNFPADEPLRTQMAEVKGGHFALVAPHITKYHGESAGSAGDDPFPTITANSYDKRPGGNPPMALVSTMVAPVIAGLAHGEHKERAGARTHSPLEPVRTIHAGGGNHALVSAFLAQHNNHRGGEPNVGRQADLPMSTVTSSGSQQGVVAASLVHLGHGEGAAGGKRFSHGIRDVAHPLNTVTASGATAGVMAATLVPNTTGNAATSPDAPLKTVATGGHHILSAANMIKLRGTSNDAPADGPLHTVSAQGFHHAEVRAFLTKYYGTDQDPQLLEPLHTCTTKDRFGLVTVKGESYQIVDIGMRMLTPRELYRAQGFKDSYVIDWGTDPFTGERITLTKTAQVRMCGNSVCPPVAAALVRANYAERVDVGTTDTVCA